MNKTRGFTLIELLVSVTILSMMILMTGIVITQYSKVITISQDKMRANAEAAAVIQNLRRDFQSVNMDGFMAIVGEGADTPPAIMIMAIGSFPELYGNMGFIIYSLAKDNQGKTYLTRELLPDPRSSPYMDKNSLWVLAKSYCAEYQTVAVPPTTLAEIQATRMIVVECSELNLGWFDGANWQDAEHLWLQEDWPKALKIGFTIRKHNYEVVINRGA